MRRTILAALLGLAVALGQEADALKSALDAADETMRDRGYAAAAQAYGDVARQFPGTIGGERAAHARLRALFLAGAFREVLSEGDLLLKRSPAGAWADKTRFLMADAFDRTGGFASAATLLRERAEFLAGDAYRERLAAHFLSLADAAYLGREDKDEFGRARRTPDFALALDLYRRTRAVRVPPARAEEVDFRIAGCLQSTNAHAEAADAFLAVVEAYPAGNLRAAALLKAGASFFAADQFPKGRAALERLRRELPDAPEAPLALKALADEMVRRGGPLEPEGFERYRLFLETTPDHPRAADVAFSWPSAHAGAGRHADAEPLWRAFLRRFPADARAPQARVALAGGLLAMRRFDDAVAEYRAFLAAHPNDPRWQEVRGAIPSTLLAKADALMAEKRHADAILAWQAFLQEYPDDGRASEVLLKIAEAHRSAGEIESMLRILGVCAEKYKDSPSAPWALLRIARHQEQAGRLAEAIAGFEELVRRYPNSEAAGEARTTLGELKAKRLQILSARVFTTKEEALLRVETRNIRKLQARAYRVDLGEYFSKKRRIAGIEGLAVDVVKPEKAGEYDLADKYEAFRLFARDERLPASGAAGAYVVVTTEEDLTATTLAVISDLRVVAKASHGRLFAWCFRAGTHEPWPGARLLLQSGDTLLEARTGPDGTARIEDDRISGDARLFAESEGHYAFSGGDLSGVAATGYQPVGYVFTDRPLYRPGHTVRIAAFLRDVVDGVYAVPAGRKANVVVTDRDGVELLRRTVATDDLGVLETEAVLDAGVPLGECRILVECLDRSFAGRFTVAEFRKPEFEVACETPVRVLRPGERATVRISARYLGGGAMAGAPIRLHVEREPFSFDASRYDSLAWFFRESRAAREPMRGNGETVADVDLVADASGAAVYTLETDREAGDARYVVEVQATDVDRLSAFAACDLFATRQDHFGVLDLDRRAVRPGEEFRATLITVDPSHAPVARAGRLSVVEAAGAVAKSYEVSTGADGRGEVRLKIDKGGLYELRYEAGPEGPGRVVARASVAVQGESIEGEARLMADRRFYVEGETARLLLDAPVAGVPVLLTLETDRVISHRFLRLDAKSGVLEIPLESGHAPNVFASVAIPGADRLFTASTELVVFRHLNVSVKPGKEAVGPGEEEVFDVLTTDAQGRPVPAAVALSVVDDGIYLLRDDPARGIRQRFYDVRRKHTVVTTSSAEFRYEGVTRETNKDLLAEERRLRGELSPEETARRYVEEAKEKLKSGDAEGAKDALRKALEADANSLEAAELLERQRLSDKDAARPPGAPAPEPSAELAKSLRDEKADHNEDAIEEESGMIGFGGGAGGGRRGRGGRKNLQAGAGASAGMGLLATARTDLRDTAWFSALTIRTDKEGRAQVRVKMPENLTTWRTVARGITAATLVGETEGLLRTWKPLRIRVNAPRFLTDRDAATVTTAVHNDSGDKLDVTTGLRAEGVEVTTTSGGATPLEPGGVQAIDWSLQGPRAGGLLLTGETSGGAFADAAESRLRALPYGIPWRDGWAGSVKGSATTPIDLPANAVPGSVQLLVSIAPTLDSAIVESIAWLQDFPYGCVEQTIHGFLPTLMAERALGRLRSPHAARLADARRHIEEGLRKLLRAQREDGSFGWWRAAAGDPYVTALALWACAEARAAGYDPGAIDERAAQALAGLREKLDDDGRCYLQWALALSGRADLSEQNRLFRNRSRLSPPAIALLAMACQRAGQTFPAQELRALLVTAGIRDGNGFHIPGLPQHRWLFSEVEATAYALLALSAEQPLGDDARAAARWLMAQRRGAEMGSTKETGPAAIALLAFLEAAGAGHGNGTVVVRLNDEEAGRAAIRDGVMEGRGIAVAPDRIRPGRNVLVIESDLEVFWAARLDATLRVEGEIPAEGALIRVDRRYRPIEEAKGPTGYDIVHPDARPAEDKLRPSMGRGQPGERVTVEVRVHCREPQSYMMIEDPLPAGFEVLEDHETGPIVWKERRDTKMVFFAADLPAGTSLFTYRAQAVFPGRYAVVPATAFPMYRPRTSGRGSGALFEIGPGARGGGEFALPTPDEQWDRAGKLLAKKEWAAARPILAGLMKEWRLRDEILEEAWAALLRIDLETGDAAGIVTAFEELRARNPRRLPEGMADLLRVGRAYGTQEQHRLAAGHFRSVVGLSRRSELEIAEVYGRAGLRSAALQYLQDSDALYPDDDASAEILRNVAEALLNTRRPDGSQMLAEGLDALLRYTARFPQTAQAADLAFRAIGVLTRLQRHDRAVAEASSFLRRYGGSRFLDDATVFLMNAQFEKGAYDEAAKTAGALLSGLYPSDADEARKEPSPFRPGAEHLLGKIAHARGDLAEAARRYRNAVGVPDAAEALAFLEERRLELEPLAVARPDSPPVLRLRAKNVDRALVRVFPVDLFVLFAVRPSLTDLHLVDLTGIAPVAAQEMEVPGARPFTEAPAEIAAPLPERGKPGAYLVTLKAGDLERSCILLVSTLSVEIRPAGANLRVYASQDGRPAAGALVKLSDGARIRAAGRTDARGVFEAPAPQGPAAVVAEREGHYAVARLGP